MRLYFSRGRAIICAGIFSAVFISTNSGAAAAPFHYDEAISGDLPNSTTPLPIFPFGVGVNTIAGRLGDDLRPSNAHDSFAFTIPGGTQLVAGRIELTDFVGDVTHSNWRLRGGSALWNQGAFLGSYDVPSPGFAVLKAPLGPGVYNLAHMGITSNNGFGQSDYRFTFEVVPEPAAVALLATSLVLMSGCRRKWHP